MNIRVAITLLLAAAISVGHAENSYKGVGRVCHRYPLRDELPAHLRHDSRSGVRPLVRPKRIKVRALVRQSGVRFGTTVEGGAVRCGEGSCRRRTFKWSHYNHVDSPDSCDTHPRNAAVITQESDCACKVRF